MITTVERRYSLDEYRAIESLLRSGVEVIQELLNNPSLDCLELY